MKEEKGFSLMVLVITIVVLIILAAITINSSDIAIGDAIDTKKETEARIDDDKIKEIMTYELAGTKELIDEEIDLKRVELNDTLIVQYKDEEYGNGYSLYLSEKDINKTSVATGESGYKPFKEITKSYLVNYVTGEYVRLEEEWKFKE